MTSETELKPCPFCGGLASMHVNQTIFSGQRYKGHRSIVGRRVECEGSCHSMTCWWHTEAEAITAWNTRTPDTAQLLKDAAIMLKLCIDEMKAWPGYGDTLDDAHALLDRLTRETQK